MKNAVIFCPNIDGHRQVYCSVLADWLNENHCSIILAVGCASSGADGINTSIIRAIAKRAGVTVVDLGNTSNSHLVPGRWIKTLLDIEERFDSQFTVIPIGDEVRLSLKGLGNSKTKKLRRAIIFTEHDKFYLRDYSSLKFYRMLRAYCGWLRWNMEEFLYFSRRMWDELGVDIAFSTNPDFFRLPFSYRFDYLPEIHRTWDIGLSGHELALVAEYKKTYQDFLASHQGSNVILYYGMWCARRGYDWLLKLSTEVSSTVFVSCGRPSVDDKFQFDVPTLRSILKAEDRIFEAELPFLAENEFVDQLFSSCNCILMPYNNVYALSGILIQAAEYGKPVLVPSVGHLKSMVSKYCLGLTYRNGDYDDFVAKHHLIEETHNRYKDCVKRFGNGYKRENIFSALSFATARR